jgi:type I restriction enzyme, S subunit
MSGEIRRFKRYPAYKDSGVEWLGEIPEHWDTAPLKHLAGFVNGFAFKPDEWVAEGTPIIRIENLNGGDVFNFTTRLLPQKYVAHKGDLLFGWSGNRGTSFGPFLWWRPGIYYVNQHIFLIVDLAVNKAWLYWALRGVTSYIEQQAHGIIGMVHVTRPELGSIAIPLLPSGEQSSIADFLQNETATIDELVAKKERLIDLLHEKRSALITRAVTKGLDPNAQMKDSGVECIGEIPRHWPAMSLAYVSISRCDGPFGSGLKSGHYAETGVRVIRLQNIGWAEFVDNDQAFIDENYASQLGDHSVVEGDLLIAGLGDESNPVGRACVAPAGIEPAMVKADCFRFRLDQRRILPDFAAYQLSALSTAAAGSLATGATRSRMNLTTTAARKIAVPPIAEQRAIIDCVSRETQRYTAMVERVRTAIEKLVELRSAIISAAVTGKIDVREEVA